MFGSIFDDCLLDPLGRNPLNSFRKNQALLAESPKVFKIKEGRKVKTPVAGYVLKKGIALASKWEGCPNKTLSNVVEEREIFTLSKSDGSFTATYEVLPERQGHLLVAHHPSSNGFALKRHMEVLREIFFGKLRLKLVWMRAAIPKNDHDLPMNTEDRRMDYVYYETPRGSEKRTRLFKTWLSVCRGAVPRDLLHQAENDALVWLTPHEVLKEKVREELNSVLPDPHPWSF